MDAKDLTITYGSGKNKIMLEYGRDYELVEGSYVNNFKTGTAKVTLKGIGEYSGQKTVKFKIYKRWFK